MRSKVLALLCVAGLLTPVVTRWIVGTNATLEWLVDLGSHWQWLFAGVLIVTTLLASRRDRRWMILLMAAPLPWFTAISQATSASPNGPAFNVGAANVGLGSRDAGPVADWMAEHKLDLVALCEVSPAYAKALDTIPGYAYRHVAPRQGPFGIALLSRHPLADTAIKEDTDGIPRLRTTVLLPQRTISVTVLHPMPPIAARYHRSRDQQLRIAALESQPHLQPALLLGDLNASPWSSGLRGPAEAGFSRATTLSPTWPAVFQGIFGIPIDHILMTHHWQVGETGVGPDIGSDHLPVRATLSLRDDMDAGNAQQRPLQVMTPL